jgi:hypothetical protein
MKALIIGLLITVSAITYSTAAVTVSSIDLATWNAIHVTSSTDIGGFSATIRAGGNVTGVNEYGVSSPGSFDTTIDVAGWWNWNSANDFVLSNVSGDITLSINGVLAPLFSTTTPYNGFAFGAYANYPLAGISVSNMAIDGNPLGDLSASWGSDTFQGYKFGYGTWSSISGKLTMSSGLPGILDPSGVDVHFGILGLSTTPEPSRALLVLIGFLGLAWRRRH